MLPVRGLRSVVYDHGASPIALGLVGLEAVSPDTLDGDAATKLAQRLDNVEKQISSFTQGVAIKDVLLDAQNGAEIQDHAGNPINAQRLYMMV